MSDADAWRRLLEALQIWMKETGSADIPTSAAVTTKTGESYPLGSEIIKVRRQGRTGKLSAEQQAQLERLPGWEWSQREAHRHARLARLSTASSPAEISAADRLFIARESHHLERYSPAERRIIEALVAPRSAPERFVDNARAWLKANPGKTLADVKRREVISVDGEPVALGRQLAYVREHYGKGTKISAQIRAAIEALPGWTWAPEGRDER